MQIERIHYLDFFSRSLVLSLIRETQINFAKPQMLFLCAFFFFSFERTFVVFVAYFRFSSHPPFKPYTNATKPRRELLNSVTYYRWLPMGRRRYAWGGNPQPCLRLHLALNLLLVASSVAPSC